LTWGDVDLDRGAVTFATAAKQVDRKVIIGRTKSGKSRVVTLGANAIEELRFFSDWGYQGQAVPRFFVRTRGSLASLRGRRVAAA
jgi:integrase